MRNRWRRLECSEVGNRKILQLAPLAIICYLLKYYRLWEVRNINVLKVENRKRCVTKVLVIKKIEKPTDIKPEGLLLNSFKMFNKPFIERERFFCKFFKLDELARKLGRKCTNMSEIQTWQNLYSPATDPLPIFQDFFFILASHTTWIPYTRYCQYPFFCQIV